jgi:hypothetical protein
MNIFIINKRKFLYSFILFSLSFFYIQTNKTEKEEILDVGDLKQKCNNLIFFFYSLQKESTSNSYYKQLDIFFYKDLNLIDISDIKNTSFSKLYEKIANFPSTKKKIKNIPLSQVSYTSSYFVELKKYISKENIVSVSENKNEKQITKQEFQILKKQKKEYKKIRNSIYSTK